MRLPVFAAFFSLISFVVVVAAAQPAPAPPAPSSSSAASPDAAKKDDARKHFEEGLTHFDRSEWSAALAEFLTSRSLFATRAATKDAAICLRKEARFDEALEMWEALEREFTDLAADDKALADREIADLRRSVGAVTIRGGETGANVVVDGRARGTLPLAAPVRVSAGTHVVRVYKEGFVAFETRVDVAGQQTVAVDAHLDALTQSGRLRVTEEEGKPVNVVVDNIDVGKAPWEGSLAVGDHVVVLRGDGTLGTQPVDAPIRLNQLTPLTLIAENLDATARVDPTPGGATVAVDGVVVGRGVWDGRLRVGGHKIEVAQDGFIAFSQQISLGKGERKIVTAQLDRDPTSPLWGASAKSKFVVEIDGAFTMAPVFGGDVVASCTGGCSPPLPIGALGMLHAAYQLPTGLGFGLEGGYLALSDSLKGRTAQVVGTRLLAPEQPGTADDQISLRGLVIGASGAFHRGDTWPLTVRIGVGAFIANARDARTGSFKTSAATINQTPYTTDDTEAHSATYLYAAPEVRFGRRFGDHLEINVGVQLWILSALSRPSWQDVNPVLAGPITAPPGWTPAMKPYNDGEGGFGSQTLTGGFLFCVAPGLGLRYEF
jgi:PEGA domain